MGLVANLEKKNCGGIQINKREKTAQEGSQNSDLKGANR